MTQGQGIDRVFPTKYHMLPASKQGRDGRAIARRKGVESGPFTRLRDVHGRPLIV
jgi:hypothetical protein